MLFFLGVLQNDLKYSEISIVIINQRGKLRHGP